MVGVFIDRGLQWQHFRDDRITPGNQHAAYCYLVEPARLEMNVEKVWIRAAL